MFSPSHPTILFDGVCNFCNGAVNFLIRQDARAHLRFAPLQSEAGQQLLRQHHLPTNAFESFILVKEGKVFQRSDAVLQILPYLPWYWQWARMGKLLPAAWRDGLYQAIARNRYRWFGKKAECMVPTKKLRERFLQ